VNAKMAGFADLMHLLETDIPECRMRLKDSHTNLEKVASYCEGNYLQVIVEFERFIDY
jgi:hypothetical protein